MGRTTVAKVLLALGLLALGCNQGALVARSGQGGSVSTGGSGQGGSTGQGGSGGSIRVIIPNLPDGGLSALIGDSGILNGILDAPKDSLLGQLFCDPDTKLGSACSTSETSACVLPSLGGACICLGGSYMCPTNTSQGPSSCPQGASTGSLCTSPLSVCIGGGANACICGLGSYTCF